MCARHCSVYRRKKSLGDHTDTRAPPLLLRELRKVMGSRHSASRAWILSTFSISVKRGASFVWSRHSVHPVTHSLVAPFYCVRETQPRQQPRNFFKEKPFRASGSDFLPDVRFVAARFPTSSSSSKMYFCRCFKFVPCWLFWFVRIALFCFVPASLLLFRHDDAN